MRAVAAETSSMRFQDRVKAEAARVADLSDMINGKNATIDSLRQYADGLVKREQTAKTRVAMLEDRLVSMVVRGEPDQGGEGEPNER
jgi:hypothetical protein